MTTVLRATPDRTCLARHSLPLGPPSGILTSAVSGPRWRFIGVQPEGMGLTARCRVEVATAAGPTVLIGQPGKERGDQASEGNNPRRLFDMDARCLGTGADPFTIAGDRARHYPVLVFSPRQWDFALEHGTACCQQARQVIIDESAIGNLLGGDAARQRQKWTEKVRRLCPNASVAVYKAFTN